ncbi:MAG: hypothetical protein RL179_1633, partial [Planctomycetota bacterium]
LIRLVYALRQVGIQRVVQPMDIVGLVQTLELVSRIFCMNGF